MPPDVVSDSEISSRNEEVCIAICKSVFQYH